MGASRLDARHDHDADSVAACKQLATDVLRGALSEPAAKGVLRAAGLRATFVRSGDAIEIGLQGHGRRWRAWATTDGRAGVQDLRARPRWYSRPLKIERVHHIAKMTHHRRAHAQPRARVRSRPSHRRPGCSRSSRATRAGPDGEPGEGDDEPCSAAASSSGGPRW
jgi:hypothetical protein